MKQFAEKVSTMVSEILEKEAEVMNVPKVNKNMTGICIKDGSVGAVFYIDEFYEDDFTEEECAAQIVKNYMLFGKPEQDFSKYDYSFEAIKDKLVVKAVGIENNRELLSNLVYKDTGCGLAIIPAIDVAENYMCNVTKSLAKAEGYDMDELLAVAFRNSAKSAPATMFYLDSFMYDRSNLLDEEELEDADRALVLSNESGVMGAAAMFYEGVLDKALQLIGTAFYILPSSIHEVILVPDTSEASVEDLKNMVVAANETVVAPNEVLSNDVYGYDGKIWKVA